MKQFSKIKQFADKAFVRPDKTEVLSDDLLEAERHLEIIKQTVEVTVKKLGGCVQGQAKEGTPVEKRIKKVPEYMLGLSMSEFGSRLGKDSILGEVLEEVGKIEMRVGHEVPGYESRTESVLSSLQSLLDTDFPAIYKLKRQLAKLTENMDLARGKLTQISRHSSVLTSSGTGHHHLTTGGTGNTTTGTKVEFCKDELEESQAKVETCRDNLSFEMYELLNREGEIASWIVQYLKYQQEYHVNISNILSELLPEVEDLLLHSDHKPVFGIDLNEHLISSGRTIAYPLELCACALLQIGLKEEGLLRLAGGSSRVKKLKSSFNSRQVDWSMLLNGDYGDVHVIATCLKCYLRELPSPLLTTELYSDWLNGIRLPETTDKLNSLWNTLQALPTTNRDNLKYLVKFLKKITDFSEFNKMNSSNVAIVIGPNLLWNDSEEDSSGSSGGTGLAMTQFLSSIIEILVSHADWFFPGDFNFYLTCTRPSSSLERTPSVNGQSDSSSVHHHLLRRAESTSSLDLDPSPPLSGSSPKLVIRRKVKPPPPAPPTIKSGDDVKPREQFFHSISSSSGDVQGGSSTKREGVVLGFPPPPPPSQVNRQSLLAQGLKAAHLTKVPPPLKPPQPSFKEGGDLPLLRKFDTIGNLTQEHTQQQESQGTKGSKVVEEHYAPPGVVNEMSNRAQQQPNQSTQEGYKPKNTFATTDELPLSVPIKERDEGTKRSPLSSKSSFRTSDEPGYSSSSSLPRAHHRTTSHPSPPNPTFSTFTKPEEAREVPSSSKSRSSSGDENATTLILRSTTKSLDTEDPSTLVAPLIESTVASLSRPVPAPRSSLLQQHNVLPSGVEIGMKPGLKAKPRGGAGAGGRKGSSPISSAVETEPTNQDTMTSPIPHASNTTQDGDDGESTKPRLPYRPPRPVPPPPKLKQLGPENSTDL